MFSLIRQWFGKAPVEAEAPQPLTMLEATVWACGWKGLLNPEHAQWFAEHVERGEASGLGIDHISREIRADGGEMSAEDKKARGIRGNLRIGLMCYDRLSEEGRRDPNKAVRLTVHAALFRFSRARSLAQMREHGRVKFVRVLNCADERDCAATKSIKGRVFPLEDAPEFPLPACNADMCRCTYIADFPRRQK